MQEENWQCDIVCVKLLFSVRGFIIPVMPDITHPMLSVILNRWVTVEASRSLSCVKERYNEVKRTESFSPEGSLCICWDRMIQGTTMTVSVYLRNLRISKTTFRVFSLRTKSPLWTHRYFLLRDDDCTVFSPDSNWCEPTLIYGLESIFWKTTQIRRSLWIWQLRIKLIISKL